MRTGLKTTVVEFDNLCGIRHLSQVRSDGSVLCCWETLVVMQNVSRDLSSIGIDTGAK